MSVLYENNGVAVNTSNIDDGAPSIAKMYSSQKTKELLDALLAQITALKETNKSVRDIVGTHEELLLYPQADLAVGDIINVLSDDTHDGANDYYRYDGPDAWIYIGDVASYYTKSEFNVKLNKKQWVLASGQNIKTVNGQSLLGNGNLKIDVDSKQFYPVGAIWQTVTELDPANLFGGTWELVDNRSLIGAGNKYQLGEEGGEDEVTLTVDQMPSHTHTENYHTHTPTLNNALWNSGSAYISSDNTIAVPAAQSVGSNYGDGKFDGIDLYKGSARKFYGDVDWIPSGQSHNSIYATPTFSTFPAGSVGETGGGQPHNNLPPVHKIRIWKRVA